MVAVWRGRYFGRDCFVVEFAHDSGKFVAMIRSNSGQESSDAMRMCRVSLTWQPQQQLFDPTGCKVTKDAASLSVNCAKQEMFSPTQA